MSVKSEIAKEIKRLRILGNENAEFIQATGKGFRFNGERHPHS
jgi:hypothetical protein